MLSIAEVIVVEGKYDEIKLSSMVDATIFVTNGFSIFKDKKRLEMLRQMAKNRGVILLTDSDGAGLVIRDYLTGALPGITIKQAYIPMIEGKEKRKRQPSKEGFLGVEGMQEETVKEALLKAGISVDYKQNRWMTKARMYEDGLSGHPYSADLRKKLLKQFQLPDNLSTAKMLDWMNAALTEEEYEEALGRIQCNP